MTNDEIHGMQRPDPDKIRCRDCLYRDQDELELDGETIKVGITRDTCMMFNRPGNWKPTAVLFQNADCLLYERDEDA